MMQYRFFAECAAYTALIAAGLYVASDPVIAQETGEDKKGADIEEIVLVEAPIERQIVEKTAASGVRTETIELTRQVSFADLDLSRHADVMELERRIESIAKDACDKLDEMYPIPPFDGADIRRCVKRAIAGTEQEVQAAIAAAR